MWFECPGCDMPHGVRHGAGDGPRWGWNQSVDQPTLTPSILVRWDQGKEKKVCHSFVTNGKIKFLDDCTHPLAGCTVELPDWEP